MTKNRIFKPLHLPDIEPEEGHRMLIDELIDALESSKANGATHVVFRANTDGDFDVERGWLQPQLGRWETEQEYQNRLFKEKTRADAKEIKDRELYEQLKKRFEP